MSPLAIALLGSLVVISLLLHRFFAQGEVAKEEKARSELAAVAALGEILPTSLHPKIDPNRCIASGACINACPEKNVIGIVGNQVLLLNPLACVGHGECDTACPVQAIDLVFGSTKRGVELPHVGHGYETNQRGLYIVGELGGMGLIRNAMKQGVLAAESILGSSRRFADAADVVVIGAGPAGIGATLRLMQAKKSVVTVDQDVLGGAILHYPRAKVVMTGAMDVPLFGTLKKRTMLKEEILGVWQDIAAKTGLRVEENQRIRSISAEADGAWRVESESGRSWRTAHAVLALGRRGAPTKLGVPGEELRKVSYRLLEPEAFAGKHVLVVGGGDSAVESAIMLGRDGKCASVSISYRREAFARCRSDNRAAIDAAIASGQVISLLPSTVERISEEGVTLSVMGKRRTIRNDEVIVQIGGTAPTDFLKACGIDMVLKKGER